MKVVLVTGGGRGIGADICRKLSENYTVIINYNKSEEKALSLEREILSLKRTAKAVKADITDEKQVAEMIDFILAKYKKIDALVNNSGVDNFNLIQDVSDKEYDYIMNTNLKGCYLTTKYAVKNMISERSGSIVFISSMWGECGASMESIYSASKGGIIALSKSLAKELAPSNIRVNCVSPGVIDTDMCDFNDETKKDLISRTPLERLGRGVDVAYAVEFLLSEKASFITGQNLGVNGGFLI